MIQARCKMHPPGDSIDALALMLVALMLSIDAFHYMYANNRGQRQFPQKQCQKQ